MQTVRLIASISIGFTLAACNADFPAEPSATATLTSLVIFYPNFGTRTAATTLSAQFAAYTIDTDGVYADVTRQAQWSSSDERFVQQPSRATPFIFRFLASGHATVIARYQGLVATMPIDVRPGLSTANALEIENLGNNLNPRFRVTRWTNGGARDVTTSVRWSSSDQSIASIDARGILTFGAPGNVRITAILDELSDYYWMSAPPRSR